MNKINLKLEELNNMQPLDIAKNEVVKEKFIQIYEMMWTPVLGISGEAAYEHEVRNFNRILSEKEDIRKGCTPFSIYTAFLDVAISGLSLDPGTKAQAYLMARKVTIGTEYDERQRKKVNVYENQCVLMISGYGELLHRERVGQIRHADNPVIVYREDDFQYGERNGQKFVNYTCNLPHTSGIIEACFMKITRADGSIDYSVMLPENWLRLADYSAKQNRKWDENAKRYVKGDPNALYGLGPNGTGQIDTGFLIAKCIKHAFSTYPKARIGKSTQLESQHVDDVEITDDIYGLSSGETVDPSTGEIMSNTGFAPEPDMSAGVTVEVASPASPEANDDVF